MTPEIAARLVETPLVADQYTSYLSLYDGSIEEPWMVTSDLLNEFREKIDKYYKDLLGKALEN